MSQTRTTQPLSWLDAWMKATAGLRDHFVPVLHDTNASINRAFTWMTLAGAMVTVILVALVQQEALAEFDLERIYGFPALLCLVPVGGLVGLLLFALTTGITHGLAGLLGGSGTYDRLAYVTSAYAAPLVVIATLLAYTGYLLPLVVIGYILVLNVFAVRAVYRLGWIQAALCGLWLPGVLIVGLGSVLAQGSVTIQF